MHAPPTPSVEWADQVLLQLRTQSSCHRGSLELTSHHLIFTSTSASASDRNHAWTYRLPYSLILQAIRLASLRKVSSAGPSSRIYPIAFHLKDFESCALGFANETTQLDVFESVKQCTVLLDVNQLYAFYYQPSIEPGVAALPQRGQGWRIYDFKRELARQGIGSRTKAWRLTDVNAQYQFCPSYPALMAVPSRISDATLGYACKYRSKARIPALTYLHWANQASITRSSQPMVGLKNARSIQDEKLIEAIFTSHHFADPDSMAAKAAAEATSNANASGGMSTLAVYGATSTNLIIDARPTTNAMANVARGAGTENMDYYKGCKKTYLGIDNIHVMRDSLNRLTEALRESEPAATFGMSVESLRLEVAGGPVASGASASAVSSGAAAMLRAIPSPIDPHALRKSNWLRHITTLLEGTMVIARNVHINSSHVLIHCSDGWDRTSQLAALAELCLDPYYRTFEGLAVLIEKDWLSFGHRFNERSGHKSSEKYFVASSRQQPGGADDGDRASDGSDTEAADRGSGTTAATSAQGGGFDGQAAANAFWGFTKQLTANFSAATSSSHASGPHRGSHIKETSPVFHQFLDCIWQVMRQYPERFEFGEDYLVELLRASQECKYGTFLMDCERERLAPVDEEGRVLPPLPQRTTSVWDHLLSDESRRTFRNPRYAPDQDARDPKRSGTDMGVLFVDARDVRYFEKLFKREPREMNATLEKEAEDRRRARERLERAVRGESASTPPLEAEAGCATVAVVEAGGEDPVLDAAGVHGLGAAASQVAAAIASPPTQVGARSTDPLSPSASFGPGTTGNPPGAVDLSKGKVDPAKLGYEVRKAKTVPHSRMAPSALNASLSSTGTGAAGGGGADFGVGAGEAANRMKNLFLGGWGKLQDAVGGSTAAANGGGMANPLGVPAGPPPMEDPWRSAEYSAAGGQTLPLAPTASSGALAVDAHSSANDAATLPPPGANHNPWAANTNWRLEMQREQERIAGLGSGGSTPRAAGGSGDAAASATSSTRETKAALDPLGVL
ncbi:phosphatidylinositol-3-phosphatase ymr1 [Thecaphora frezii]